MQCCLLEMFRSKSHAWNLSLHLIVIVFLYIPFIFITISNQSSIKFNGFYRPSHKTLPFGKTTVKSHIIFDTFSPSFEKAFYAPNFATISRAYQSFKIASRNAPFSENHINNTSDNDSQKKKHPLIAFHPAEVCFFRGKFPRHPKMGPFLEWAIKNRLYPFFFCGRGEESGPNLYLNKS